MSKREDTFLKMDYNLLCITSVPSKTMLDNRGKPIDVVLTLTDKVVYTYMKKRFDFFKGTKKDNKKGSSYFDKQTDIAEALGVDVKTVNRVVKKWVEHGYMEYVKGFGNRINYTRMDSLVGGESADEIPEHVLIAPEPDMLIPYSDYDNDFAMSAWEVGS